LARSGLRVLVIDKKQEIGTPKRCAEAIEPETFEDAGIEPHPLWLTNRIRTAVLYAPNGTAVSFGARTATETGYIIERKIFEKHLAKDAILAGARYLLKTTALDVIKDGERVRGVVVGRMGARMKILAEIVVAADGVDSMTAKAAGLKTVNRLDSYMSCFQYEMAGVSGVDEQAIHLYYGNEIAPGGYAWVFPKGNTLANVGVGIKPLKKAGKAPKDYLDAFIASHPKIFENASPVEFNGGGVPVRRTAEKLVADGLMVIGDAAQLVNPISGGGIRLAMVSGRLAAEAAVRAIRKGDVGRKSLSEYEKLWDAREGGRLDAMLKLQRFTDRLGDDELNRLAEILTGPILTDLAEGRFVGFLKLLMKKAPALAPFAVKYLRS
jgi:digeranylgeranylglycerophospholipid reductase